MDSYVLNASGVDKPFIRRLYSWTTTPVRPPNPKNRQRIHRLHGVLYDAGWTPTWIHTHLKNFDDDMLEGRTLRYVAWTLAHMWFAVRQNDADDADADANLFELFDSIGLAKKVAGKLSHILSPLINCSYTDDQLVFQGFEYLLESLEIAGESTSPTPLRCIRLRNAGSASDTDSDDS
jgi:hypothetical protein